MLGLLNHRCSIKPAPHPRQRQPQHIGPLRTRPSLMHIRKHMQRRPTKQSSWTCNKRGRFLQRIKIPVPPIKVIRRQNMHSQKGHPVTRHLLVRLLQSQWSVDNWIAASFSNRRNDRRWQPEHEVWSHKKPYAQMFDRRQLNQPWRAVSWVHAYVLDY